MTYEEAVDKVAKLLRLSKSSNEHEAALAASRAQEIMDRYKIETASVDHGQSKPDEPIKDFGFDPLEVSGRKATWKTRLGSTLAKLNACKFYLGHKGLSLVGRASDVSAVRYIYGWLVRECELIARQHCQGCGISYANNFKIGMAETVVARLLEQQKQTRETIRKEATSAIDTQGLALIRVNAAIARVDRQTEEVNDWCKQHMEFRTVRRSSGAYNQSAREAGRQAGNSVRIQPTKARIS